MDLQRAEDVADRHTQGHALGAVDVEVDPGCVGAATVEKALQPCCFVAARHDLVADALQFVEAEAASVLNDEFETVGRAQARDRRGAERRHDRPRHLAPAAVREVRGDGAGSQAAALVEAFQNDIHRAEVRCIGVQDQRLPGDTDRVCDPWRGVGHLVNVGDDLFRALDRGRIRKLHGEHQVTRVLVRNEPRRGTDELKVG